MVTVNNTGMFDMCSIQGGVDGYSQQYWHVRYV